jgi:hypothetical protein
MLKILFFRWSSTAGYLTPISWRKNKMYSILILTFFADQSDFDPQKKFHSGFDRYGKVPVKMQGLHIRFIII